MDKFDYDLFVIGGGSGGVRAGRVSASLGKKVGIAEEYRFGGTCVIRGCVPKKLMVYASHFSEAFEDAAGFGWTVGDTSFNWSELISNKDTEIARLEGLYRKGLSSAEAEIFDTRAVLKGPNTVHLVNEDRDVTAEKIIVATGGTPNRMPNLPGSEFCIASDEVFHLEELPGRVVIYGGGYIALEFACIFSGLGSQVTVIYRGEEILRGFDDDLRDNLHMEMAAKGIDVRCETLISSVSKTNDDSLVVVLSDGSEIASDQVMLATGRDPLTNSLGLEDAGVETDERGFIRVDEFSRTNVSSVWALGDVTNRVALTPVAIHEAMCFVETEYRENPTRPDHELIATAVFTQPEIGTVGMSESQAAEKFAELDVYRAHFRPLKHTLTKSDEKTLMKIVCDSKSDRVLGVHILGPDAGEMAQTLAIALKMGAKKSDFDRTMAVHPTASEELVTMYQPSYRIVNGELQS